MKHIPAVLFSVVLSLSASAQTTAPAHNKAVFNKIESFINKQMTDSIYNLAAPAFKKDITAEHLGFVLNNLYQLGKITETKPIDYKEDIATYLLRFGENSLRLKLTVDQSSHYHLLAFEPAGAAQPIAQPETSPQPVAKTELEESESIAAVAKASPTEAFINSLANGYINQKNTASLSIALFHENAYKTFFYGETAKGSATPPTEDSMYEIGSLTKLFTATILAELANKKKVNLESSITKFLPDSVASNPALKAITLKSLANHTSGLPRLADNWNTGANYSKLNPYAGYDKAQLYSFLKNYKPGDIAEGEYEYSNVGFGLLGELIAVISGKSYMENVQEFILTPLQMLNTTDVADTKKEQVLLPVYDAQGKQVPAWSFQAMLAAGGLKSSSRDMMLFAIEQFKMTKTDLQYAMALTRQFTAFGPSNMDMGLAWHMSMLDGMIYFHHTGGTGGSSSYIGISPDTKTALIILSNSAISVDQIGVSIMEKLLKND